MESIKELSNEELVSLLSEYAKGYMLYIVNSIAPERERVIAISEYAKMISVNTIESNYLVEYSCIRKQLENSDFYINRAYPLCLKTQSYITEIEKNQQKEKTSPKPPISISLRGRLKENMFDFLNGLINDGGLRVKTTDTIYMVNSITKSNEYFYLKLGHTQSLSTSNTENNDCFFKEIALSFSNILSGLAHEYREDDNILVIDISKIYFGYNA